MDYIVYIAIIFFIIAIIYSSVGFGGGSSYLAIMALFGISYQVMPKISLLCNIIVVSVGCYIFYKEKHLSFQRSFPFVFGSVPLAYLGGSIDIDRTTFLMVLSISLLIISFIMFFFHKPKADQTDSEKFTTNKNWILGLSIGSGLGFLSGIVGLGGGVFLAPILHFINWGSPKKIAAISSFFILINSISGIIGQFSKTGLDYNLNHILILGIAVFIGGQIGSNLGAKIFPEKWIKMITAGIIFLSGVRELIDLLY